jgi:Glycoside Hydrolase Family 113
MRQTHKPIIGLAALLVLLLAGALLIKAAATDPPSPPGSPGSPNADPEQREGSDIPPPSSFRTSSISNHNSAISPPTLPHRTIRGVNYAHLHRAGLGYGSDASKRELTNLQILGVNWIALTPFGYQRSVNQDHVAGFDPDKPLEEFTSPNNNPNLSRPGEDPTLTDRNLADQVAAAHALGVKVLIKPHIWSSDFWRSDDWHGTINQTSPQAHERWRKSYLRFILHYAKLAQDTNADALCIGTELLSMTTRYPEDWRTLIREVRKVYSGKLTYAAHWDKEFQAITFWDQLDAIGISAYFPLDVPDDATVDQLVAAWLPHKQRIEQTQALYKKPIVFLEVGYRPATGTYRGPWLDSGGELDPMIQSRAYEALFRTYAEEPWWHGLFIWKVFTDPNRSEHHGKGPGSPGYSFRNRPAEQVIKQWFHKP